MIKNDCEHEWEKHTNFKQNLGASTYLCKKCNANMAAAEVFQLEALQHLRGFQMWAGVIAIIISLFALFVSIFK